MKLYFYISIILVIFSYSPVNAVEKSITAVCAEWPSIIQIGIVVDAISEVLNIKNEDIEDTPTFGTKFNTDYILGMVKMEAGVKILLDIDLVLRENEIE